MIHQTIIKLKTPPPNKLSKLTTKQKHINNKLFTSNYKNNGHLIEIMIRASKLFFVIDLGC
jgi:hypothetical protein